MFDSNSYKLQIPERSCKNCMYSENSMPHEIGDICCGEERTPVENISICSNFSLPLPVKTKKAKRLQTQSGTT